jgi:RHS repeat-associated protein
VILAEQYRSVEPRACAPGQKTASRIFFESAPKSRLENLPQVADLHQEKPTRLGQTCARPSSTAEERDAAGNVTKRFFSGGEQIGGVNYYFAKDHLGSVREMTDASGAVCARYDYDPYGRSTKVSGDLEADFGFTGFYRHQASGLNLTLFRAYDPELGRWTTRDPIAEIGGLNLYAYVGNEPISFIDSLGLKPGDPHYGLPRAFWNWAHQQGGFNKLKGPDGNLPKDVARRLFEDWKKQGRPDPRMNRRGDSMLHTTGDEALEVLAWEMEMNQPDEGGDSNADLSSCPTNSTSRNKTNGREGIIIYQGHTYYYRNGVRIGVD